MFLAARELFPNLMIVIRDPAHAIRLASQSLHCDDVFGEVWRELFDGRHALAPDIKNSAKWHNLFVAIQEDNVLPLRRWPQSLWKQSCGIYPSPNNGSIPRRGQSGKLR